jgi:hypothetical protein
MALDRGRAGSIPTFTPPRPLDTLPLPAELRERLAAAGLYTAGEVRSLRMLLGRLEHGG